MKESIKDYYEVDEEGYIRPKSGREARDIVDKMVEINDFSAGLAISTTGSNMFTGKRYKDLSKLRILIGREYSGCNLTRMFEGCEELEYAPDFYFDGSSYYGFFFDYMFKDCYSLKEIPYSVFTSGVSTATHMFENCESLKKIVNLNIWTNQVRSEDKYKVSLDYMFKNCTSLSKIDNFELNLYKTNGNDRGTANELFAGCTKLKTIDGFKLDCVENSNLMFLNCTNLTKISNIDLSWSNLHEGFKGCTSLKSITDTRFHHSYLKYAFEGCSKLKDLDNVEFDDMGTVSYLFKDCTSLISLDGCTFKDMSYANNMFEGCTNLESVPEMQFEESKYRHPEIKCMFKGCKSLKDIGRFDIPDDTDIGNPKEFFDPSITSNWNEDELTRDSIINRLRRGRFDSRPRFSRSVKFSRF